MNDRLVERCAIEFECYVAGLHDSVPDCRGVATASVPWSHRELQFTTSEIPRLIHEIRTVMEARAWFSQTGPAWAQPLPIGDERSPLLRATGALFLLARYSFSLELMGYDYLGHPPFATFCAGAIAHPRAPAHVRDDLELQVEFPAKTLPGLGGSLVWFGESLPADRLISP